MEGNPMDRGPHEPNSFRETTPTEREESFAKWKTPLEVIVPGIDTAGLKRDEEFKSYESSGSESSVHNPREGEGSGASTEYIQGILNYFDPRRRRSSEVLGVRNFITPFFKDRVIVDFGSGSGEGYYLARECQARGYIGVDKFSRTVVDYRMQISLFHGNSKANNIPFAVVEEDMLRFLHRIPNDSVSILTCAVTVNIGREYAKKVETEIARALDPEGAYITHFSEFEPKTLILEKCEDYPDRWGGLLRFTKKSTK